MHFFTKSNGGRILLIHRILLPAADGQPVLILFLCGHTAANMAFRLVNI